MHTTYMYIHIYVDSSLTGMIRKSQSPHAENGIFPRLIRSDLDNKAVISVVSTSRLCLLLLQTCSGKETMQVPPKKSRC